MALPRVLRSSLVAVALVALVATGPGAGAALATAPWKVAGQLDFNYGAQVQVAGGAATGERSESKLFYTPDHRWWAVLGNSAGSGGPGVYLYELVGHVWTERLELPDADPWMKADTLFAASDATLYATLRDNRSTSDNPRESAFYRLGYLGAGMWESLSGPTAITTKNPEVLTLARDSLGRVWVAFEDAGYIRVLHTQPGSTTFSPLARLPLPAKVSSDDVAAVRTFTGPDGPAVGVMWSDQIDRTFGFAWRDDDDPTAPLSAGVAPSWEVETAYGDGIAGCGTTGDASLERCGDDHISLASNGQTVYAAIKTSLNDGAEADPADPLIVLLRRSPDGTWDSFEVSSVAENATRPIVVVNPLLDRLHVFANYRGVHVWESPLGYPAFSAANRARWTAGGTGNPTSTKQPVTPASGTVVETSHRSRTEYHHNEFLPLPPG